MFLKIIRTVVALTGGVLGYGLGVCIILLVEYAGRGDIFRASPAFAIIVPIVSAICFLLAAYFFFPMIKNRGMHVTSKIEKDLQAVPFNDVISGTIGLICGLMIAFLISQILLKIDIFFIGTVLSICAYLFFGYLGISIATKGFRRELGKVNNEEKKGFLANVFRSKTSKGTNEMATPKILDTSVIIDGRIADILNTGFIEGKIIIPEFVLEELRHICDSADLMKRTKGRRGLDVLKEIQEKHGIEIYNTYDKSFLAIPEVDVKLLKLAEILNGKVLTTDFNLLKVAEIQGISALNINEMVNALRPAVIPGEILTITVMKEGKENSQGVGYLDDGTMVVVEEGKKLLGLDVDVEVIRVLQTTSGRMIFVKPTDRQ